MATSDYLMAIKVLLLVAAGVGFVWWQLRDLAKEKARRTESEKKQPPTP
jgi:hypothetical protein